VIARACVPSAFDTHTFSEPLRSLMNTNFFPSGENAGCMSYACPSVIRVASPPAIGSV